MTLPARTGIAERRIEQAQLRLSAEVVDRVTQVRQAWVRAVAAQQALSYARQVFESAEAGAELARRMQSVGNFNRISRAREQSFYADAAIRWRDIEWRTDKGIRYLRIWVDGKTGGRWLIAKHKAVFSKARTRHRSDQRCFELQVGP